MTRLMRREMRTVCNIDYSKPKREKRKKQSRESAVRRKKKTQQRCNGDHEKRVTLMPSQIDGDTGASNNQD